MGGRGPSLSKRGRGEEEQRGGERVVPGRDGERSGAIGAELTDGP